MNPDPIYPTTAQIKAMAEAAREKLPIFSVVTLDGRWYRSYVEEADSTGFYVSDPNDRDEDSAYHDTGGIVCIPWSEISSITRDGEA